MGTIKDSKPEELVFETDNADFDFDIIELSDGKVLTIGICDVCNEVREDLNMDQAKILKNWLNKNIK